MQRLNGQRRMAVCVLMCGLALSALSANDKFRLVYNGHRTADFYFGWNADHAARAEEVASGNPGNFKVELYRDGRLVHTSQPYWFAPHDAAMYYSDTALAPNRAYVYQCKYYSRYEPDWQWVYKGYSAVTVDTSRCSGELYNGPRSRFPRSDEVWGGAVEVGNVTVKAGVLEVRPAAVVTIHDGLVIGSHREHGVEPGAEIKARNAVFRNAAANPVRKTLKVFGLYHAGGGRYVPHQHSVRPAIHGCVFNGIDLNVYYGIENFDVTDNVFTSSATMFFLADQSIVSGNHVGDLSIGSYFTHGGEWEPHASLFEGNTVRRLNLYANNCHVASNRLDYVLVCGTNNMLVGNIIAKLSSTPARWEANKVGHNFFISNTVDLAHTPPPWPDPYIFRLVEDDQGDNEIRHNVFFGPVRIDGDRNTLFGNRFHAYGLRGDTLSVLGADNLIYNNYFSKWNDGREGTNQYNMNSWSIAKTPGANIVGGAYLGGNYWASYTGVDADGDGLGDTPHMVSAQPPVYDHLPLIGPGELLVYAGSANPAGESVSPQGQPFPAAQIRVKAQGNSAGDMLIRSLSFNFVGDISRIPAIAGAGLFRGANAGFNNLTFLGLARFDADRLTFDLAERLPAGAEWYYTLAYQYRYEDEYAAPGPMSAAAPHAFTRGEDQVRVGAAITPRDISLEGGTPVGESVAGWITPAATRYITGYYPAAPFMAGAAIETTSEILFAWELYQQLCVNQNQAVIHEAGSPGARWYLWIKDRSKLHALSSFANRPHFRVLNCAGSARTGQALPVCELLDVYVDGGRVRWARGAAYDNPYAYAHLMFDGEIGLHAAALAGNYKGFLRDVIVPLRAAFGGRDHVLIDYFKQDAAGGYYAYVRVLTQLGTFHATAALAGAPRVLERRGRSLAVAYEYSVGDNPAPEEQIFNLPPAAGQGVFADYDGDGLIDPVVYDEATGVWHVLLSSRDYMPVTVANWGGAGYVPVPADYDGDGKADPAVYSAEHGILRVWLSRSDYREYVITGWGVPGCVALPADYDGDGIADPAIYDPGSGLWRVKLSGQMHAELSVAGWGGPGYRPVPADYDGDGKADPAVYDESGGVWHIWLSGSAYDVFSVAGMGGAGYVPVPADYDGDGKADPAVMDPVSGARRVWMSSRNYAPMDM